MEKREHKFNTNFVKFLNHSCLCAIYWAYNALVLPTGRNFSHKVRFTAFLFHPFLVRVKLYSIVMENVIEYRNKLLYDKMRVKIA
jgi:hypothetical protein